MACEENSDCQDTAEHCRMRVLVLDMKDLNSRGLQTVGSICVLYLVVYGNEAWLWNSGLFFHLPFLEADSCVVSCVPY